MEITGRGEIVSYNPNIPAPTDIPANSQPQLLANFQGINTLVNVNHVGFDLADQGKHKWVTMPDQGVTNPSTLATEVATYCITSADSGNLELTFRRPSNGDIIAMTAKSGTPNGWTMLPSGLLMKWATVSKTGGVTSTDANAIGLGKPFTQLYFVMVSNGAQLMDDTYVSGGRILTATTFETICQQRSTSGVPLAARVKWIAIGV